MHLPGYSQITFWQVRKKGIKMNSCELVAYVSSLACVISKCSSREEMEILSAVLVQLGETLHMMLVHEENSSAGDRSTQDCRKERQNDRRTDL